MVGLGTLGMALGRHLCHVVPSVYGVDQEPARRSVWQELTGADPIAALAELRPDVSAVFVVIAEPDGVHAILDQLDGDRRLGPGLPVFVLTTLAAADAERVATTARRSITAWPVPVSGGEVAALRGRLLAIAPRAMARQHVALLQRTIAPVVVSFAGAGECATAKLLTNAIIAYQFAALDAVLSVGERHGLDPRTLFDAVRLSSAAGGALDAARHYSVASLRKDLDALGHELPPVDAVSGVPGLERLRRRFVG